MLTITRNMGITTQKCWECHWLNIQDLWTAVCPYSGLPQLLMLIREAVFEWWLKAAGQEQALVAAGEVQVPPGCPQGAPSLLCSPSSAHRGRGSTGSCTLGAGCWRAAPISFWLCFIRETTDFCFIFISGFESDVIYHQPSATRAAPCPANIYRDRVRGVVQLHAESWLCAWGAGRGTAVPPLALQHAPSSAHPCVAQMHLGIFSILEMAEFS